MKLKVLDALTAPGAAVNEDRWGFNPDAVWVMDGATGVWPEPFLAEPSDAAWFVGQIDEALTQAHFGERAAQEILGEAVATVAQRARGLCDLDALQPQHLPSAGLAAARSVSGGLQLINLGDRPVLWRQGGGPVQRFGTSGLGVFDERLVTALRAHRAAGLSFAEAKAAVVGLLRDQRAQMNRPDGYWILDLFGAGAAQAQSQTFSLPAGGQVLLMSDGFYRLVEVFGRYDDTSLLEAAAKGSLRDLYHELRDLEASDEEGDLYTRFKPRDDATAVLLQVD